MKTQELENKYKGIPWLEYLNDLVQPKRLLTSNDYVMVGPKIFFENIGALLAKSPKRAIANHLIWGVADFSSDKMSGRILNLSTQFYSLISESDTPKPRWRICLANVYGDMQIALGAIYVRKFFDESSKNEVSTMVEMIRNAYKGVIQRGSGKATEGEDIADNGGNKVAYQAYIDWSKQNSGEPGLPGLSYSAKQLFWLSNANTYCTKYLSKPKSSNSSTNETVIGRKKRPLRSKSSSILVFLWIYFVIYYASAIESGEINEKQDTSSTSYTVCKTKGCKKTAQLFLRYMNKSINPCQNFYQFACGNFANVEGLPEGSTSNNQFLITQGIIYEQIRSILERSIDDKQPRTFKLVQDSYKVCMNTAQIEKNSENDFRDILKNLNGWPILEGTSWEEEKYDWKNTTYQLSQMGLPYDSIVNVLIGADRNDSNKNIIYLDTPQLGSDQEYLSKGLANSIIQAYFNYMVEFAVIFGADRQQAKKEFIDSLNLEIEIAKISLSNIDRSDSSSIHTRMKIQDLENKYKGIPWLEYLNNLIKPKKLLTLNDNIMVGPKIFFEKIGPLLAKTPKRVIANYLIWSVADYSLDKMSERIQNLTNAYFLLYSGTASSRPRWLACLSKVQADMAVASGSMYVKNFFDESSKKEVLAIVNNIHNTYKRIIEQVDWMDSKTKNVALEKLQVMTNHIAYPVEFLDNKKLDELYKNYTVNPNSFLKTQLASNAAGIVKNFESLAKPINKTDWVKHGNAAVVNAYYNPTENSIQFPAGILQGLFFSKDRPKYLNYGAIGSIIGHEITHGFDDEGSQFDKYGNLFNWWNAETKKKFNERAQGIINQYNKYRVKEVGLNVSGKMTEGENLADNAAYKIAYQAYIDSSTKNTPEPRLPGLSYSPRQLFWISAANIECSTYLPETLRNIVLTNPHSPNEYRVIGPAANRPEFATDFNCSLGSPMNPEQKNGVCFIGRKKRPLPSKSSTILVFLWIYFVIHHASALESGQNNAKQDTSSNSNIICKTKGCTNTAQLFLKYMNTSVHPCENFYQFACGNFANVEGLRAGITTKNHFLITQGIIYEQARSILERSIDDEQPRTFELMQDRYRVCMNTAQIEKNSENDFRDILKNLNGWPLLEGKSWKEEKFDWKNTTYKLSQMGLPYDSIVNVIIGADRNDSTKKIIYLDTPELGSDQEYLSKGMTNPIIQAYFNYMVEFAVIFGADRQQAKKEFTESLNFEIKMAKISLSNIDRSDSSNIHTRMKIQDLENKYKGIPWLEYLNNLIKPKKLLTLNDNIMVGPKIFFENIGPLLSKTPKRAIANYLIWAVADYSIDKMSERIQNLTNEYFLLYSGTGTRRPHWLICLQKIQGDMAVALGSMYVRKFFDESSKKEIVAIVNNIHNTYKRIIEKVDWMDSKTKSVALEKLQVMTNHIAYPVELLDNRKIDELYKNYTVNPNSFLKTQLAFNAAGIIKDFETLDKPINKTDWITHGNAAVANAYYNPTENSIQFPAGILQGIFFSEDRPKYLNYGAIGSIVGHEITHGFDDEGSQFDKHGNLFNWWNAETKKKFNEKAQGIINQYNKYRVKEVGLNVSGKLTEGENIADNAGYKIGYQAYIHWSSKNAPEPRLPGLSYSSAQLFWISAANVDCSTYLPETLRNIVLTSSHSPGEYRVIGPAANRAEFAKDFNCSVGSPMNPELKNGVCFIGRKKSLLRNKSSSILVLVSTYFIIHHTSAIESWKNNAKQDSSSTSNTVCKTRGCTNTAQLFLKYMNTSVHPCMNFYQFACGNFANVEDLPEGITLKDQFSITRRNIYEQTRSILERSIDDKQPRAFKIMQDKYKVCMDTARIEKNGENDFRDILKNLNGWPLLEGKSWKEEKFDWKNTTYKLSQMGLPYDSIVNVIIGADRNDSTKNIIYLDTPQLGSDQEYLSKGLKNPIIQGYFNFMVEFAVIFGADRQQAKKEFTDSLNFQIEMAKISLTSIDRSDSLTIYTRMKIQDLEKKYKGIPWLGYLNTLLKPKKLLTLNDNIMVGPKIFFENIGPLLAKTPKRAIANYLIWAVGDYSIDKMSERIQNLTNEYFLLYSGRVSRQPRWIICLSSIESDMAIALGSMYVRNFFDENSKKEVVAIVNNIHNTYKRVIEKVDWMDSKTKNVALEKLQVMTNHIAYPVELLDNKKIDELYKNFTVNLNSFLKTQLKFNAAFRVYYFESLATSINKTNWITHGFAATVDAYYESTENSIQFPAGILQGLFFSKDRPKYLNYGAIGSIVGHEITHGFDNEGSQFDKYGNVFNWWNAETKKKFNKKVQSIINQYNKYRVKEVGLNVSGKMTKDENIADNAGVKIAYQAYVDWLTKNAPEPRLPGLSYSPRQLYWISAANVYCSKYLPETLKIIVLTNPHSPDEYRVIGPAANSLEFAKDFSCLVGSPMNPEQKNGVW